MAVSSELEVSDTGRKNEKVAEKPKKNHEETDKFKNRPSQEETDRRKLGEIPAWFRKLATRTCATQHTTNRIR